MRSSLVSSHLSRNHSLCSVERSHTLRSCHCVASFIKYIVPSHIGINQAPTNSMLNQQPLRDPRHKEHRSPLVSRWWLRCPHPRRRNPSRKRREHNREPGRPQRFIFPTRFPVRLTIGLQKDNASGIRSEHFQEHQISQRPGEPGPFDKAWNKAHYGTEKGK